MRRICSRGLALLLTLTFVLSGVPFAVSASEDGFVYTVANGEAIITDYDGKATDLVIPDKLGGYPVTQIEAFAFDECGMVSVTIPASVKRIGGGAFYYCTDLETVTFSEGLEIIEETAFSDCLQLKEANLPSTVKELSTEIFSGCDSLTVLTVAKGCKVYHSAGNCIVETASGTLLQGCAGSVIPNDGSIKKIGTSAFAGMRKLASVKIPTSVREIGAYAFDSTAITELFIPKSVTKVGRYVVYYSSIKTIYCGAASQPAGWDSKWNSGVNASVVWSYCPHETIRTSTKEPTCTADGYRKENCGECGKLLVNETIPARGHYDVVQLGHSASCTEKGLDHLFCKGCNTSLKYEELDATGHTPGTTGIITEATCTKTGLLGIGCEVCGEALEYETIPAKGHKFGSNGRCEICGVSKGDDVSDFTYEITEEGVVITGYAGNNANVKIPSSIQGLPVVKIGDAAFEGLGMESVTFPSTLKEIGLFAFENCKNLKKISIPGSVKIIGGGAFMDCSALESLFLGEGVETICTGAFSGCIKLTSVQLPASLKVLEISAFVGCDILQNLGVASGNAVYTSAGNCIIESATGTLVLGCMSSVIPDDGSVTSIGDGAFECVLGLKALVIPDSVTSIGKDAFRSGGLEYLFIPETVETVGAYAFFDTRSLVAVYCAAKEAPAGWAEKWDDGIEGKIVWDYLTCKHEYTFVSDMRQATCEEDGYTVYSCRSCGETVSREEHKATGHAYDKNSKCTHCGIIDGLDVEFAAGFVVIVGYSGNATALTIPSEIAGLPVMTIEAGSFAGNTTLESVFIPATVESVQAGAFAGCESLEEIRCETDSLPTTWDENWAFGSDVKIAWESDPKPTTLYGDVSGDGRIAMQDYVLLKRYVMGTVDLTGEQLPPADVNRDGKVNTMDYVLLKRHVMGTFVIEQN